MLIFSIIKLFTNLALSSLFQNSYTGAIFSERSIFNSTERPFFRPFSSSFINPLPMNLDLYDASAFPMNGSSLDCLSLIVQNLNRNCSLSQMMTPSKMTPTSTLMSCYPSRPSKDNCLPTKRMDEESRGQPTWPKRF